MWIDKINNSHLNKNHITCSLSARTCSMTLDHKATRPSSLSKTSGLLAEKKWQTNLFQLLKFDRKFDKTTEST